LLDFARYVSTILHETNICNFFQVSGFPRIKPNLEKEETKKIQAQIQLIQRKTNITLKELTQ